MNNLLMPIDEMPLTFKDADQVADNDCFNTPFSIFKQLDEIFNFTLDAACDSSNIKCPKGFRFDQGQNGLNESWRGERVFCNPPFSDKDKWLKKAVYEVEDGGCPVAVMILPLNCMSAPGFFENVIGGGIFLRYSGDVFNLSTIKPRESFPEIIPGR